MTRTELSTNPKQLKKDFAALAARIGDDRGPEVSDLRNEARDLLVQRIDAMKDKFKSAAEKVRGNGNGNDKTFARLNSAWNKMDDFYIRNIVGFNPENVRRSDMFGRERNKPTS